MDSQGGKVLEAGIKLLNVLVVEFQTKNRNM